MSKVIIATAKQNNDWYNVTDNTGREINISLKDKKSGNPVNQKLKAALDAIKAGDEVEIDVREWQGKFYGNEPKSAAAGKKFVAADKSFDAAKTAALACATLYANKTQDEVKNLPATFEAIHKLIMSKVTKAAEGGATT
jgi:hypothetical protein